MSRAGSAKGKKKILFVCVENSCRSQMAEGLARQMGRDAVEVFSAGSRPSRKVNSDAVRVMREIGIDIAAYQPKSVENFKAQHFDYVISMGCGEQCPFVLTGTPIEWAVEDPKGKDLNFFRKTRDKIYEKLLDFLKEIL